VAENVLGRIFQIDRDTRIDGVAAAIVQRHTWTEPLPVGLSGLDQQHTEYRFRPFGSCGHRDGFRSVLLFLE
jgi:hypothetical protein